MQIYPGTYTAAVVISKNRNGITVRAQNASIPPVLSGGFNIYDCAKVTVQDLVLKREINIRNSTNLNIQSNSIEVAGYSPSPGK